jgi:hypothetical protein
MPGPERQQIDGASAEDQNLPGDRDLEPSHHGRPNLGGIVRAQSIAQQTVVEAVLDKKSRQENGQAEP